MHIHKSLQRMNISICLIAFSSNVASLHAGVKAFFPLRKVIDDRHIFKDELLFYIQDGTYASDKSLKTHATKYMHSLVVERPQGSGTLDSFILSPYRNESDDIVHGFPNDYLDTLPDSSCYSESEIYGLYPVADDIPGPETLPTELGRGIAASTPMPLSDTSDVTNNGFSDLKENVENFITGINQSVDASLGRAEDAVQSTYNTLKMSFTDAIESFTQSIESVFSTSLSSVYNSKEQAGGKLTGFSSMFKENVHGVGGLAIDTLRRAIVMLEDSLGNTASFLVYSYGSAKSLLPPNIKESLDLSEEKAIQIIEPVGAAFQKVYAIIEGFEKILGLDPTDPIVQFVLFFGSSAAIGTSYWFSKYGGYSGDLTPETTFMLLKDERDAVLIDVRPEDLRERDGVPDLRRGARSKYASVVLPEIDGSVRKLLRGGREVDYSLIAAVIRSLKIIKNEAKVIVMDANGGHSKAIARSLKKLGVKNPYLVQGGFQSWVKNGLRIKELKPETALTLLNENVCRKLRQSLKILSLPQHLLLDMSWAFLQPSTLC
ncbi:uncharacterized protein LOC103995713 isoform X3 [Musa acuminata AAA Group]|uniref:uncharacterized protein LOC103995713 isoform X3 n=1 Tax=Musa acuminata AAA Group TaxID=214697 RepID=UPI0031DEAF0A